MVIAGFVLSWILTYQVRRVALAHGLLDYPNSRSSHVQPTPRAGGLSVVVAVTGGLVWLLFVDVQAADLAVVLIGGGLAVAVVGLLDDRGSVSVPVRIATHTVCAALAAYVLDGLPKLLIGERLVDLGVYGYVLAILAIVWTLNLFNFMDGIDGIAASEAVFIAGGSSLIMWSTGTLGVESLVASLVAAASLGFLLWNWPPAKIFMGDVGSSYLGYVIAVLALSSGRANPTSLYVWLILGGMFFVDATVTLGRRLLRGERVYQAHRSHAYQRLARKWDSHLRVTLLACGLNIGWLLPMAWLAAKYPQLALAFVALAFAPLIVLAILAGAGRAEHS